MRASDPVKVVEIAGLYNQRVRIEYTDSQGKLKKRWIHAGQLIPLEDPYVEGTLIGDDTPVGEDIARELPPALEDQSPRPPKRRR